MLRSNGRPYVLGLNIRLSIGRQTGLGCEGGVGGCERRENRPCISSHPSGSIPVPHGQMVQAVPDGGHLFLVWLAKADNTKHYAVPDACHLF